MNLVRLGVAAVAVVVGLSSVAVLPGMAHAEPGPSEYTYDGEWVTGGGRSVVDAIAVDEAGRVYVASPSPQIGSDSTQITTYDPNGARLSVWEVPIRQVADIDVEASGNLLLTDPWGSAVSGINSSVRRYSAQGQLLVTMSLPTSGASAAAVVSGPDGVLWVTDATGNVIHKFNSDGTYLGAIGRTGVALGEFDRPWGIGILPNGNLLVSDGKNARIQVLTTTGEPVTAWGQPGFGDGQFDGAPSELEVRDDGYVYVVDDSGRVQAFTATGEFVGAIRPTTSYGNLVDINSLTFGPGRALLLGGYLGTATDGSQVQGVARYLPAVSSPPPPSELGTGKLRVSKKALLVKRKRLVVRVSCSSSGGCAGKARVTTKRAQSLTKPTAYRAASGDTIKVVLKVTKKGMRVLRRAKVTKAVARLSAAGLPEVKRTVKVRRPLAP